MRRMRMYHALEAFVSDAVRCPGIATSVQMGVGVEMEVD